MLLPQMFIANPGHEAIKSAQRDHVARAAHTPELPVFIDAVNCAQIFLDVPSWDQLFTGSFVKFAKYLWVADHYTHRIIGDVRILFSLIDG